MIGPVKVRHLPGEFAFVEGRLGEAHGESGKLASAHVPRRHCGDDRRVDATAEEASHGHVGQQVRGDGVLEQAADFAWGVGVIVIDVEVGNNTGWPVTAQSGGSPRPQRGPATRGKLRDLFEEQLFMRTGAALEISGQPGGADACADPWQESAHLRGKDCRTVFGCRKVERLDAEAIAAKHHFAAAGVVNGEGKHAAQPREKCRAPDPVAVQQRFGVAVTAEPHPELFQFPTQFRVVVDLAIENDDIASGFIAHRLRAGFRKIDDGQARVTERDLAIRRGPSARRVRPARAQPLQRNGKIC